MKTQKPDSWDCLDYAIDWAIEVARFYCKMDLIDDQNTLDRYGSKGETPLYWEVAKKYHLKDQKSEQDSFIYLFPNWTASQLNIYDNYTEVRRQIFRIGILKGLIGKPRPNSTEELMKTLKDYPNFQKLITTFVLIIRPNLVQSLGKNKTKIERPITPSFRELFSTSYGSDRKIKELKKVFFDNKLTSDKNVWNGRYGVKNELSTICHYLQENGVFKVPMNPTGLKVFHAEFGLKLTLGDRKESGDYANLKSLARENQDLHIYKLCQEMFTSYLK